MRTRLHVISKRIVGGHICADGAWPWQVALFLDGYQVCGGSLISNKWILSACHCFKGMRYFTIVLIIIVTTREVTYY